MTVFLDAAGAVDCWCHGKTALKTFCSRKAKLNEPWWRRRRLNCLISTQALDYAASKLNFHQQGKTRRCDSCVDFSVEFFIERHECWFIDKIHSKEWKLWGMLVSWSWMEKPINVQSTNAHTQTSLRWIKTIIFLHHFSMTTSDILENVPKVKEPFQ